MKSHLLVGAAALALAGCTTMTEETQTTEVAETAIPQGTGYFAQESTLPFHAPDFTKINDADYAPAIKQGIEIQQAEIAAIANNPAAPTIDNTLVAMERSGAMLSRTMMAFYQEQGANTNDVLDATETEISPLLAAHGDAIYLNDKLFQRIKTIYDNRASMTMMGEDAMLLEVYYNNFVHAGALLSDDEKVGLRAINGELSSLETDFSQKLTAATSDSAITIDTKAELAGLSEAEIASAAKAAADRGMAGKFLLTIQNTTQQPYLSKLENRATRKKLFDASVGRTSSGGENDTRAGVLKIAKLRAQKAELLGSADWATYTMYDRMAKQPSTALGLMEQMVPALSETQVREAALLNAAIKEGGGNYSVEPWDWAFYAEKVRKAKYDLDESEIKPYFEVTRTLEDGIFYMANELYGLTFEKRDDIPVYHPDVTTYTVFDKDGSELALFYFDPFARDNKQGGAWMGNFVEQSFLSGDKPVIHNTLNIPKPAAGQPALVSFDNVGTMFHEFGHALHGMFASQKYPSLSGTNTARDFVEFPSQFHEPFATLPEVLAQYAKHYQTGETIPAELVAKMDRAGKFNQGYALGETLSAALLDMKWHALKPGQVPADAMAFETTALASTGLNPGIVPPRYSTPYFRHIWANGYSAGYYSYVWTEMLSHDAYSYVEANGGMTRAMGDRIRSTFLGQGHSKDYNIMYRDFAGRDPSIEPMLVARGLKSK
ncbi:M3 family metallopeptidase [Altererythrobacter sp. ZODW24]|uniref:M3 family metallopeptidase n=1 Tax=Altererythrobacter sp. ZODW24 TaxID=2185142 RepID=UPI000DF7A78A|nr:M3 family metallopeptidase [Altererythrobacter sp. ZODW24]